MKILDFENLISENLNIENLRCRKSDIENLGHLRFSISRFSISKIFDIRFSNIPDFRYQRFSISYFRNQRFSKSSIFLSEIFDVSGFQPCEPNSTGNPKLGLNLHDDCTVIEPNLTLNLIVNLTSEPNHEPN